MSKLLNVKMVKCPICGLEMRANNLWRHLKRHKENPESFIEKEKRIDLHCKYCGKLCKNLNSLWHHEHTCKMNPDRKVRKVPLKNCDWRKGLTKETDERIKHNAEAIKKYYETHDSAFKGKHHSEATKQLLRDQQLNIVHRDAARNTWSLKGYYNNIFFMSTWELAYYIYMSDAGHKVEKCNISFEYEYQGKKHNYTPDFILDNKDIIEIKGRETELDLAKYKSITNLVVLYKKDIEPMIEYVKTKFKIKKLTELFDTK